MKKFVIASASAIAVLGLAACSDTDDSTTRSVEPGSPAPMEQNAAPPAGGTGMNEPAPAPGAPPAPAQ